MRPAAHIYTNHSVALHPWKRVFVTGSGVHLNSQRGGIIFPHCLIYPDSALLS